MYLSFGAHLSRFAYDTAPVGLFVVQQLLMKLSCALVHARCSASHKAGAYTLSFSRQGGGPCSSVQFALDSPITGLNSPNLSTQQQFSSTTAAGGSEPTD